MSATSKTQRDSVNDEADFQRVGAAGLLDAVGAACRLGHDLREAPAGQFATLSAEGPARGSVGPHHALVDIDGEHQVFHLLEQRLVGDGQQRG